MAAVFASEEVGGQRCSLSKLEEEYLSMLEGVKTITFFKVAVKIGSIFEGKTPIDCYSESMVSRVY